MKLLTTPEIFDHDFLELQSPEIVPELAGFAPNNALFFMNGIDLYGKYNHTKTFLTQLHPQFALIFDGLLRAQSRNVFGESFDFEKQLLSKMHGQYSTLIDIDTTDPVDPQLYYVFMTKFGGVDQEKALEEFELAFSRAQSRFVSVVESVELPDGTVREELTSVPASQIPIKRFETGAGDYYVFGENTDQSLAYGVSNGYFVFSTREVGVKRVFDVLNDNTSSLSTNQDFRESVLFKYAPSESYGFVNFSQLDGIWSLFEGMDQQSLWMDVFSALKSQFRTLTFARRVYPEEVFFTFTLFNR